MKKLYFLLFTFLITSFSFSQGTENFDNFTETGSSYASGTFTGQDGSTWTYVQSRGDQSITDKSIMLGRNRSPQAEVYSGSISGGVGTINFNYQRAFSTNVNLNILVNDVVVGNVSSTDGTVQNSGTITVNEPGNVVLKFISVNNSDGQVTIDDISWTGYSTSCNIIFGESTTVCTSNTVGDNNDAVIIQIPYTGLDATITSVTTTSGGTVAGDNPASVTDGTITITGLFEGDPWDIVLGGTNCAELSSSGTTPAAECDPIPDTCFNLSDGSNEFEIVTLATNVDGDVWTNSNGTYAINGFCGGSCSEETNGWLIFGPLDMQGASDLSLLFTASESFSGTDLNIQYTSDYSSLCPDSSTWTSAAVITDAGTYSVDLSAAIGNDVFVGIEYNDSDGFSGWSLTNVELAAFGQCPTLGTIPTSACATCTINLQTENYVCLTNTAGDNNDGVTVEIPYTGSDTSGGTLSTTSLGVISGDISVADSTITITGLSEGDAWDLTINGGNCDTTTVSGTIPVAECDPSLTVNVGITGTVDGVYINEIHYDNTDTDVGEFFEVAGPAGTDLSSYTVSLYNGNDDELYGSNDTFNLTGTIDDEGSGVGAIVVSLPANGLQNGGPDGLSLSKTGSNDIQFLTYEGVIASAGDGPAIGLASVDIGVSENQADTPAGYSLEYDETTTSWIVVTDDTPGDFAQGTALSNGDFNLAKFSVFPNPTNLGYVNITSTNGGTINAKVFDILGKKVIDASIENNRLDVNQLKTGIYIIKMTQGTNSTTKKLVIE
ncbi:T9SS type A sorting domain-containing protein [Flavobacteriaceae bacterium]|nr:T9SS type A sorting domain-containing protein [Flavobacteriaceae bacterium]